MSRDTEKALKELNKFMDGKLTDETTEEEMKALVDEFIKQYNDNLPGEVTEENATTSSDYFELAMDAETEKDALRYARKAAKLDPDNLDALKMIEEIRIHNPHELLKKYEKLIELGKKIMEKKGYMDEDSIGDYWPIIETRPFMRLYESYVDTLKDCGMMKLAANAIEEMLRYNTNDNQGMRHLLMHIYAYLEDEEKAVELYQKYCEYDETMMLLPLSVLYYKKQDYKKAEEYLKQLKKINKDTHKFLKKFIDRDVDADEFTAKMDPFGFRPYTMDEFVIEIEQYYFLFENTMFFFHCAEEMTRSKRRKLN